MNQNGGFDSSFTRELNELSDNENEKILNNIDTMKNVYKDWQERKIKNKEWLNVLKVNFFNKKCDDAIEGCLENSESLEKFLGYKSPAYIISNNSKKKDNKFIHQSAVTPLVTILIFFF